MIEVLWAVPEPHWTPIDDWAATPDLGVPRVQGPAHEPGWITALRVDGTTFYGHDHYLVNPGIVAVWSDDPDDPPYEAGRVLGWSRVERAPIELSWPVPDGVVRHGVWLPDADWYRVDAELIQAACGCRGSG